MRRRFWWEAPLADIKNHNELEAWLQRRQQREVSVAFAARAALRVLPILWQARGRGFKGDFLAGIVLPVFRATGVAWVTARYPDQEMPLLLANAAGAASIAAVSAPSAASVVIAATSAATTAASATLTNAAAAAVRGADAAARAAHAAYGTGPSFGLNLHRAATPLWTAVSIDATRVDEGATASVIADSPLWPERQPDRLPFLWQELKAALLAAKQDWDVWTDWYDDRLDGRARERDLAYVRIEEALWAQGPAIVNAEIKKLIEETPQPGVVKLQAHSSSGARVSAGVSLSVAEPAISAVPVYNPPITGAATQHLSEISSAWQSADAASAAPHPRRQYAPDVVVNPVALGAGGTPPAPIEAIPEQEPLATRFGVNTKGLIDLVPDPPAHGTAADPLQREFYEETRLKAQALVELGPNLLGALSDPANRFREGLKDRIEDISITSLWSRGNTLRIRLKAHDLSVSNGEPDLGRLHTLAAETLRDVVHTWNIFIVGDRKGASLMKCASGLKRQKRQGK